MQTQRKMKCPICGRPADIREPQFPFCSARCQTIDLANWASESYVASSPLTEADENLQPPGSPDERGADE